MEPLKSLVAQLNRTRLVYAFGVGTIAVLSVALAGAVWVIWARLLPPVDAASVVVVAVASPSPASAPEAGGRTQWLSAFSPGKACDAASGPLPADIAAEVRKIRDAVDADAGAPKLVVVGGHDWRPLLDRRQFPDNRSLAAARAACVVRLLKEANAGRPIDVQQIVRYNEYGRGASRVDVDADRQTQVIVIPGGSSGVPPTSAASVGGRP